MDSGTQRVIILVAVLICATLLGAAMILQPSEDPAPAGTPVTFCPPRLPDC